MNIEKQELNEKLLKFELKKKYLTGQNELLSDIYDVERSNKYQISPSSSQQQPKTTAKQQRNKRVNLNVDLSTSEQFKARQYLATEMQSHHMSAMEAKARTKILIRDRLQRIQNQSMNAVPSMPQHQNEHIELNDYAGILKLKLIKLECRPNVDANRTACKIRVAVEKEGYHQMYESSGYRHEQHAFRFDKEDEFRIVKVLNNSLVIEVLFGDCVQDRIKLSMADLTKSRIERRHQIRVHINKDSFYHNSLHFKCQWRLRQTPSTKQKRVNFRISERK